MQRKAYVPGVAALLAALLAGCTGGSGDEGSTDNSNPGKAGTASAAAQPGKYTTLPEACGVVAHSTLDSLLPGIKEITDEQQRETAYEGEATLTYDTDRKVGCRWKVQSTDATDRLFVDFERVVSYDNAVSDDNEAQGLFAQKIIAADLPAPTASGTATQTPTAGSTPSGSAAPPPATPAPAPSASAATTPPPHHPRRPPAPPPGRPRRRGVRRRRGQRRRIDGETAHRHCGVPHVERHRDRPVRGAAGDPRNGS